MSLTSDESSRNLNEEEPNTRVVEDGFTVIEKSDLVCSPGRGSDGEEPNPKRRCSGSNSGDDQDHGEGQTPSLLYERYVGLRGDPTDGSRTACLRCDVVGSFGRSQVGRTIVHSVFYLNADEQYPNGLGKCLEAISGTPLQTSSRLDNWIVAVHDQPISSATGSRIDLSHIHLIHGCQTYASHRTCRCSVIGGFKPVGFLSKRRYFSDFTSNRHIEEMVLYLSKGGRQIHEVCYGDKPFRRVAPNKNNNLPHCGCEFQDPAGFSIANESNRGDALLGFEPPQRNAGPNASQSGLGDNGGERGSTAKVRLGQQTTAKILELMPSSYSKLRDYSCFKRPPFEQLYWDKQLFEALVPIAWDTAVKEWNSLSTAEVISARCKFPSTFLSDDKTYYAPRYSANLICRLILEQCGHYPDAIDFVDNLLAVLDKTNAKKNAFVIVSAPSAGKTFLYNSLLSLFWNTGKLRNPKKGGDTFTYEAGVNTRVNEWNECVLHGKEAIDDAKGIWEGNSQAVNKKYASGAILRRTPLLVAANAPPWSMCPEAAQAFQDRCYYHYWTRQPWLEHVAYFPNPLAWRHIFKEYKEESFWQDIPEKGKFADKLFEHLQPQDYTYLFSDWLKVKTLEKQTLDQL